MTASAFLITKPISLDLVLSGGHPGARRAGGCRDPILARLFFFIPVLIMLLMTVAWGHCGPLSSGGGIFSLNFVALWE